MVSWWGGDGNPNDIIGTNHGVMNGAAFAPGMVGQAFSFDGVNDYVEIPNSADLNPPGAFTVDGWFYIDPAAPGNVGGVASLAAKTSGGVGDGGWFLWFQDTGGPYTNALRFDILTWGTGGIWPFAEVSNAITSAGWYHIAGVFDLASDPQAKLYLNGVLVASSTSTIGAILNNTFPVRIGASHWTDVYNPGNDRFEGMADEVEFFDHALSAEEIAAIYNAGSAGKCRSCVTPPSGMISWWGGDGNPNDIIGTNHGTLQGGATYATGKVGQAFSLDGVSARVSLPNFLPPNNITVDAWINLAGQMPPGGAASIWGVGPPGKCAICRCDHDSPLLGHLYDRRRSRSISMVRHVHLFAKPVVSRCDNAIGRAHFAADDVREWRAAYGHQLYG
jgi:hypothetical protein